MMIATTWFTSQLLVNGVVSGLVIGLLAMGIVLVYRATKVLNFAVGNIGVVGATLLSVMVVKYNIPFWPSLLTSLVVGTAFAVAVELSVIRRLFAAPRVILLVATIGIAQLALAVATALPSLGSSRAAYPVPVSGQWSPFGGVQISGADLSVLISVPVMAGLLSWFLNRTAVGKSITASADNPELARLSGINPKTVSTIVWALAGFIGTLALILVSGQGLQASMLSQLGPDTLAQALIAAVIAGLRSFPWAMAAGVLVGLVESVLQFNFINEPGIVQFVLFLMVLVAVAVQSRSRVPEPHVYPTTPKVRPVPEYLRSVWWIRHLDKSLIAIALAVAVILPILVTQPSKNLLYGVILAYAICASSLTVVTGWSGLLSLGQMAFAGLGALTAASLTIGMHVDWALGGVNIIHWSIPPLPFWVSIAIATGLMAVLAAIMGVGAIRVNGMLLAVITFVFALAAQDYLYQLPIFGGGQQGSVNFIRGGLFGLNLSSQRTYYYLVLVALLGVMFLLWRLRSTGVGRELLGVRDNPTTAASYGVAAARVRVKAFALAGAIAGFGGALLAGAIESVPYNQEFFLVNDSLVLVAIVVIGGLGSISGAVIGAVWVIGLPAFFPNNNLVALLTSSIGLLVVLLYFPGGLAQIGTSIRGALISLAERRVEPPSKKRTAVPEFVHENAALADQESLPPIISGETREPVTAALEVRDITVAFGGNLAVDRVSLNVRQGEVVGLIGANGAGKSTLMNAIGGYDPCRGKVLLRGADVSRWSSAHRAANGLGRTFQGAVLFPELTVRETVELACERRHPSGLVATAVCAPHSLHREKQKRGEAADLIDFMGLGRYADHYVAQLSTGTRRIVEMASLLGMGAWMLCLDEPTSGVAQREAEQFGPLILQLRRELGGSVLVIEHDMALLLGMSDRVYCLEAGALLAEGTPEEIRLNPVVIASYLGIEPGSDPGQAQPPESQQPSLFRSGSR